MSEKREKFQALSEARMAKATKAIESIGKLSSSAYEWEKSEVEGMFEKLENDLAEAKARYERTLRWKRAS